MTGTIDRDQPIQVDFRKYPDLVHWQFAMWWLGGDEHGIWLWAPRGTWARRGNDEPILFR